MYRLVSGPTALTGTRRSLVRIPPHLGSCRNYPLRKSLKRTVRCITLQRKCPERRVVIRKKAPCYLRNFCLPSIRWVGLNPTSACVGDGFSVYSQSPSPLREYSGERASPLCPSPRADSGFFLSTIAPACAPSTKTIEALRRVCSATTLAWSIFRKAEKTE